MSAIALFPPFPLRLKPALLEFARRVAGFDVDLINVCRTDSSPAGGVAAAAPTGSAIESPIEPDPPDGRRRCCFTGAKADLTPELSLGPRCPPTLGGSVVVSGGGCGGGDRDCGISTSYA